MGIGNKLLLIGALTLLCCAPLAVSAGTLGGDGQLLLAQGPGMMQGQPPQGQQGMQRQPQGQQGMQPAQPGGQGGNDPCMQSYQRCVMMCAGVGNCVNNCNLGYAACQGNNKQPQGGGPRPGGS
ncbi:hypothetical protein DFW101_1089 [Solidesulfovibrio carbinoliphilus subsp. oakridgensis]|uniref:Uncharacterized protein n=1 Tax=Solidesulfovibrio carbinoliphilus subsp. oakridgensis TaxID=694327 RepID=G7Q7E7_9BACT|nr:hypothetical protein [Solidesulfovibrio carbinoliphilus]EHJ47100.1 hypothetical protein DFW101_1089 [Solidesulfovibrio carbinoliphilus subsp. oakridgensis]